MSAAASGFLPRGAPLTWGRIDQGQDLQTKAGGFLLAIGAGYVKTVASDPGGFGPNYPVLHFTSGPFAGKDVYYGHTHSLLRPGQKFKAGQPVSVTGKQPVGNASVPGWAEIGLWPPGSMSAGRSVGPALHALESSRKSGGGSILSGLDPSNLFKAITFQGDYSPGSAVGGTVKDAAGAAADAAANAVLNPLLGWIEPRALEGLLYFTFVVGGAAIALYGLAAMLGQQQKLASAAGKVAGAVLIPK